jgi:peptidoglycan/xylan/chitin deacetylase (PgdA/CDA1 family)
MSSPAASGSSAPRHWHAAPLLRASIIWHIAAALLTLLRPSWWPWTLAAVMVNHLLLTAIGLWPRSRWIGSNWTRLPPAAAARGEIAITLDDGPDPAVTPQVLSILAQHGAHATFFCIGERARQFPQLVRDCIAQGHAIENHSQRHSHLFSLLGIGALRAELQSAQQTLHEIGGTAPRFFRAPAGLRNVLLDPVLQRMGLQLTSWSRRGFDTVRRDPRAVLERLCASMRAGDILLLHDGHAARTADGTPVVLEVLPELLRAIARCGLHTVTLRQAAL